MSPTTQLRIASLLEGSSFLMLLFLAMPLKYAFGMPMAVRIAGGLHGLLFVNLLLSALRAKIEGGPTGGLLGKVIALSFVPFGFLAADRQLRSG
jgi:integral membrane protein